MTKCPYCDRPVDDQGCINHVGYCPGLETVSINRLQYDSLRDGVSVLEAELARLNMEMAAYRQKLTPEDAKAMRAVIDALYIEKRSRTTSETKGEHT